MIQKQQAMLTLSLMDLDNELFPMDIKILERGDIQRLKSMRSENKQYLLSLLLDKAQLGSANQIGQAFSEFSLSLASIQSKVTPVFLETVPPPVVNSNSVTLTPPKSVEGIFPIATYISLSRVEPSPEKENTPPNTNQNKEQSFNFDFDDFLSPSPQAKFSFSSLEEALETLTHVDIKLIKKHRIWEIFNDSWVSQIQLPQIPLDLSPGKYFWEVVYLGGQQTPSERGSWTLEDVSHLTRSILEINISD